MIQLMLKLLLVWTRDERRINLDHVIDDDLGFTYCSNRLLNATNSFRATFPAPSRVRGDPEARLLRVFVGQNFSQDSKGHNTFVVP